MLKKEHKQLLQKLVDSLSKEELIWANGYISGLVGEGSPSASNGVNMKDFTIIYVTDTGNSKFISEEIAKSVKSLGGKIKIKASTSIA